MKNKETAIRINNGGKYSSTNFVMNNEVADNKLRKSLKKLSSKKVRQYNKLKCKDLV